MTEIKKKNFPKWLYPVLGMGITILFLIQITSGGTGSDLVDVMKVFLEHLFGPSTWGLGFLIELPFYVLLIGLAVGMIFWKRKIGLIILGLIIAFSIHPALLTKQELHNTAPAFPILFLKHLNNSENGILISGIFFVFMGLSLIMLNSKKWWRFIPLIIFIVISIQPSILAYQQLYYNKDQLIKKWDLLTPKEIAIRYNLTEWQVTTPFLGKHKEIRYYDLGDGEWRYKGKLIKNLLKQDGLIK